MLDRSTHLRMYETMTLAKQTSEKVLNLLMTGQMAIMWFSPRGQEVIGAALGVNLEPDDYLVTTYRGVHEMLGKGVALNEMWAEWLGKATGSNKGKSGVVHYTDPDHGIMSNSGIIGGGLPVSTGLALSSSMRDDGRVTVCTFGDGQVNCGAFHESVNLAAVWKLPLVFLCQNNRYAETTAWRKFTPLEKISDRAAAYSIPGVTVDGNDPVAIYEAIKEAVDRARNGGGPSLVEAMTYRFFGHYIGDMMTYMPSDELAAAMAADPVPAYRTWLIENDQATDAELTEIDQQAAARLDEAYEFAKNSPDPDPTETYADTYRDLVEVTT